MLKLLDKNTVREVYNIYMVTDFPADELKPLSHIERMMDEGFCFCYGFYENEALCGYAYLVEYEEFVLVDYLAVVSGIRGQGVGSRLLAELKEITKGKVILIECEDTEFSPDEKEKTVREKRIAFYQKSGFLLTETKTWLFGVDYVILTYPESDRADEGMKKVYLKMLGGVSENFRVK